MVAARIPDTVPPDRGRALAFAVAIEALRTSKTALTAFAVGGMLVLVLEYPWTRPLMADGIRMEETTRFPDTVPPDNARPLAFATAMDALRTSKAALTAFAVGGSVVLVLA